MLQPAISADSAVNLLSLSFLNILAKKYTTLKVIYENANVIKRIASVVIHPPPVLLGEYVVQPPPLQSSGLLIFRSLQISGESIPYVCTR